MNHQKSLYIQEQGCQYGDTDKSNEIRGYYMNENQPDAVKAIGPEKCNVHDGFAVGRTSGRKSLSKPPLNSCHIVSDVKVPQRVDDRGRLASEEDLIEKDWFATSCNCSRIRAGTTTDTPTVGICHRSRLQSTDIPSLCLHELSQYDVASCDDFSQFRTYQRAHFIPISDEQQKYVVRIWHNFVLHELLQHHEFRTSKEQCWGVSGANGSEGGKDDVEPIDNAIRQLDGISSSGSASDSSRIPSRDKIANTRGGVSNKADKLKMANKELKNRVKELERQQECWQARARIEQAHTDEKVYYVYVQCHNGVYLPDSLFQVPGQYDLHPVDMATLNANRDLRYNIQIRTEPELVSVEESGYGWALINLSDPTKNKKTVQMRPATELIHAPGCRWTDANGQVFNCAPRTFIVYLPLFDKLNTQFRSSTLNEHTINAVKVHSTLDSQLNFVCQDTGDYYLRVITVRYYKQIQSSELQSRVANNAELISIGDNGQWVNYDHSANMIDRFTPWEVNAKSCDLGANYNLREDFEILKQSGMVFYEQKQGGQSLHKTYEECEEDPSLKTQFKYPGFASPFDKTPSKVTYFFRFSGFGAESDFFQYANDQYGLNSGLKRLLGGKEDEISMRRNALLLGAHLARKMSGFVDTHNIRSVFWELVGKRKEKLHKYGPDVKDYLNVMLAAPGVQVIRALHTSSPMHDVSTLASALVFDPTTDPLYQQREFVAEGMFQIWKECTRTRVDQFVDGLYNVGHWAYYGVYDAYLTQFSSWMSRTVISEIQHVKRKLRQAYVKRVLLDDDTNLLVRNLDVLVKREFAKFGKAPRLYVSYDAGCMYANELPEFCKVGLDGKHVFTLNGVTLVINVMAKPKRDSLEEIFTDLYEAMNSRNFVYVAIFSDDSCMAGNINGRVIASNLDVVSNDSSQDLPAFLPAYGCMGNFHKKRALGLIRQCLRPLMVRNPNDPSQWFSVQMDGPLEGSGSTLTTLLNHLGSIDNALSIFYQLVTAGINLETTDETIASCCSRGAAVVGHSVTYENIAHNGILNVHKFQFLKRSPFQNGSKWSPYINLGCILRSLGSVEDNLQANQLGVSNATFMSLSHESRINLFCTAIINGWKYEPTNPIMAALRERFCSITDEIRLTDSQKYVFNQDVESPIDYSSCDNTLAILARYEMTVDEMYELADQIRSVHVGQTYRSRAMTKILAVDYGVEATLV